MTAVMPMQTVTYSYEFRLAVSPYWIKSKSDIWCGIASAPDCDAGLEQLCRAIAGRIAKSEKVPAENLLRAGHFIIRRLP